MKPKETHSSFKYETHITINLLCIIFLSISKNSKQYFTENVFNKEIKIESFITVEK